MAEPVGLKEKPVYSRAKARAASNLGLGLDRCSLYLADDHALFLRTRFANETARRFYYADIQALTCYETRDRLYINLLALALALCCFWFGLVGYSAFDESGDVILGIFSVLLLPCAGVLVVNTLRGRTCVTWLHAAVHSERLDNVGRVRSARPLLAELAARIRAAQDGLEPPSPGPDGTLEAAAHDKPLADKAAIPLVVHDHGSIHEALFFMLLIEATLCTSEIVYRTSLLNMIDLVLMVGMVLLCIAALVKQRNTDLPAAVRMCTAGAFVFIFAIFQSSFVLFGFALSWGNDKDADQVFNLIAHPFEPLPEGPLRSVILSLDLCVAALFTVIALAGLISLHLFRRRYALRMSAAEPEETEADGQMEGERLEESNPPQQDREEF